MVVKKHDKHNFLQGTCAQCLGGPRVVAAQSGLCLLLGCGVVDIALTLVARDNVAQQKRLLTQLVQVLLGDLCTSRLLVGHQDFRHKPG